MHSRIKYEFSRIFSLKTLPTFFLFFMASLGMRNIKTLVRPLPPGFKLDGLQAVYFFSKSGIMKFQENDFKKNLQPSEVKMKRLTRILIISIVFGIVLLENIGYSVIAANDIVDGFPDPEAGNIESSVTEGSSLFFQGMADLMTLFDEGEKGAANVLFPNSANLIDSAIARFKMAKEKYVLAANMGKTVEKTRCNFTYLKTFDYDRFAEENGLMGEIVNDVKKYLANGDAVGFYRRIADDLDNLITRLGILKEKLNFKPAFYRDDYWQLLGQASRLMLFGNYGTMVGKTAYNLL
jgi:hypothetical protein